MTLDVLRKFDKRTHVEKSIDIIQYYQPDDEARDLILCITRSKDCHIGDCAKCGWNHAGFRKVKEGGVNDRKSYGKSN